MKDTIEVIRKLADFRPLNLEDTYDFINRYYLPRLDTMPTKRKIFLYPINGVDFKEVFNYHKTKLEKEYAGDTNTKMQNLIPPPPQIFNDKTFSWNSKRLINTKIIADTTFLTNYTKELKHIDIWHQKYGYGYMCISYPQYNSHTKRLVIREWTENNSFCGTGRERKFYFTRIPGGWKAD
ncbi:MAG TPA: hypothetical protein VGN20_23565 [Mucilaginibacter sp.]